MYDLKNTLMPEIELRTVHSSDLDFIYRVYIETRADEMAMYVSWDEQAKTEFLRMQFNLQQNNYQHNHAEADYYLIIKQNQPIGCFYIDNIRDEIRILDIALLTAFRGQGIGSAMIIALQAYAEQLNKPISLHVKQQNQAKKLYSRLGFVDVATVSLYQMMRWFPGK